MKFESALDNILSFFYKNKSNNINNKVLNSPIRPPTYNNNNSNKSGKSNNQGDEESDLCCGISNIPNRNK